MKQLSKYKNILILLVVIFIAVQPLLHYGLPPTHDGENHVIRVYEFDKSLREGTIYPRWADELNNGYGVPLFNYVYPMPNYIGALFHALGASFIDAFKLNLLVATLIGVLFFYFWARLFFGLNAALVAAVFYAFSPYRFVDIYVRGSVGEVWSLAFFPAFLWSVTKLFKEQKVIYVVLSSVFLAATILSHNILALMFFIFGITYTLFLIWHSKNRKHFLYLTSYILLLSLCLSAIFWLPALMETKYVQGLQIYNVDMNFPELYQLLFPSWGTGFSGGNLENQMSFQIGVMNLVAIMLGFVFFLRNIKKKNDNWKLLAFFLCWFVLIFYLLLYASRSLWHTIPLLDYFQFPWRFLSLMIIICSFVAGIVIEMIKGKRKQFLFASIFIITSVCLSISYTYPAYYHNRTDSYYLTRNNFIHGTNSPGDLFNTIWINKKLPLKKQRVEVIQGNAKVIMQESKIDRYRFFIDGAGKFVVNIAYFPGWTLYVDGKKSYLEMTRDGLMTFSLNQGKHMVELRFNDTMVRRLAAWLSLAGLFVCLCLLMFRKRLEFGEAVRVTKPVSSLGKGNAKETNDENAKRNGHRNRNTRGE